MYDKLEIGTILTCYRTFDCDFMPDDSMNSFEPKGTYRFKPGYTYTIKGYGSLFMIFGAKNPYTGEDYKAHNKEVGFSVEFTTWNHISNSYKTHLAYFSTDPKSVIFYGKWFLDDKHLREAKLEYLLEEEN